MKRILLTLLVALLWQGPAQADRLYRVEMLVFANLDPQAFAGEYWPVDPGEPDLTDAPPLSELNTAPTRLDGIAHRLDASGRYRTLFHRAWIQSPGAHSLPLDGDDGGLMGRVRISRGRFLHVDLDLRLTGPRPEGWIIGADQAPAGEGGFPFRMQAHRKMRPGRLHYIDHPLFGVVMRIDRVTAKE